MKRFWVLSLLVICYSFALFATLPQQGISPNPATCMIAIECEPAPLKDTPFTIYNSQGLPLITQKLRGPHTEIDISELPSGIYIVTVGSAGETMNLKLVKYR